jgi:hypothetical protein
LDLAEQIIHRAVSKSGRESVLPSFDFPFRAFLCRI